MINPEPHDLSEKAEEAISDQAATNAKFKVAWRYATFLSHTPEWAILRAYPSYEAAQQSAPAAHDEYFYVN